MPTMAASAVMPDVTESHRLAAFQTMRWKGWTYEQAQADPIRRRVLEVCAHAIRKRQWLQEQRAQNRRGRWFDAKAAAAGDLAE